MLEVKVMKEVFEISFSYILDKESPPDYEQEFYNFFEKKFGKIEKIELISEDKNPHETYIDYGMGQWALETFWTEAITTKSGRKFLAKHYYTHTKERLDDDFLIKVKYTVEVEEL